MYNGQTYIRRCRRGNRFRRSKNWITLYIHLKFYLIKILLLFYVFLDSSIYTNLQIKFKSNLTFYFKWNMVYTHHIYDTIMFLACATSI